jgi:hypothetical protein
MFQLSPDELESLKSQIVTSSYPHGGRRKPVWAFTEQGIAMLSSVLRSPRAVQVNIAIMRAFVRLREALFRFVDELPAEELATLWSQLHSDALPVTLNRQQKELVLMEKPAAYGARRKRR